jgi:hypothetical protein
MHYYQEAMNSIYKFVKSQYIVKKGVKNYFLDFPSPTIKGMNLVLSYQNVGALRQPTELIANGYDRKYWDDKITKVFHRTTLLSKFRGFDPFFRALTNDDTIVRHHFRIFTFRKMSSNVRDVALMTLGNMISDFEPLINELGPKKAEAYVDALLSVLEELDSLRDDNGKIREISEADIITALKHNFGTEWRDAYNRILEANDNDLTNFRNGFNKRGKIIQNQGYKEFLKQEFEKYHNKDLPLILKIQLSSILCTSQDAAFLNAIFAGLVQTKYIKVESQTKLNSFY